MTQDQAIAKICKHLKKFAAGGEKIDIYTWPSRKGCGVRVAEISFSTPTAGTSFMQSDPEGLAMCAAVERCAVALMEKWPKEEIDDQFAQLDWIINS